MQLKVVEPGFLVTVQDLGRVGFRSSGVPVGGAMDRFALMAANRLVGNPQNDACLEFYASGPALIMDVDCVVAATGRGFCIETESGQYPAWLGVQIKAGQTVRLVGTAGCCWGYVAIAGGVVVPEVMGSRSTYLRGHFGGWMGRALRAEDVLPIGAARDVAAGNILPEAKHPRYSDDVTLRVVPGPQRHALGEREWRGFIEGVYHVSTVSDRMGYRLQGHTPISIPTGDILSEAAWPGAVQMPSGGQPVVLMCDAQTSGGYAKVASIISADLHLLAQCPLGAGQVHFSVTAVTEARHAYAEMMSQLDSIG
jgi:antagonist of KipI